MSDSTKSTTKAPSSTIEQDTATVSAIILAYVNGEATLEQVQATYGSVQVARRGQVQGKAMMGAMKAGATEEQVEALYEALTNLPKATTTRTKATLTEEQVGAVKGAIEATIVESLALLKALSPDPLATELLVAIEAKVLATVKGASSGTKATKEGLASMIARGAVKVGAELVGPNGAKATVNADGTVTLKGKVLTFNKASVQASGAKACNGYGWWRVGANGPKVGTLR